MTVHSMTFHEQSDIVNRRRNCRRMVKAVLVTVGVLLLASSARADSLTLNFSGDLLGTGSLITDGTCSVCSIGNGLLSLTIDLGAATGASAFDIVDDPLGFGGPVYTRSTNELEAPLWDNSENLGQLVLSSSVISPNQWSFDTPAGDFSGHFSIAQAESAVPEPNTFILLLLPLLVLGFSRIATSRVAHSRSWWICLNGPEQRNE